MSPEANQKVRDAVLRIREIGVQIAALSKESKTLRAEVAASIVQCGLGPL